MHVTQSPGHGYSEMNSHMKSCSEEREEGIKISDVSSLDRGLNIRFSDSDSEQFYSSIWLRDHGIDSESLDPDTLQRKVDTFSIPADLAPRTVKVNSEKTEITIDWNDSSSTTVSVGLLASLDGRAPQPFELAPHKGRYHWDSESPLAQMPSVSFEDVMSGEQVLLEWLENIAQFGFSLVTDVPTDDDTTEALAERLGSVQETLFGRMWHLSAELVDHGDSAYSTQYLEPHTDGSYYHDAPGLQMFNCQEFNGKGGESILVDGFAMAQRFKVDEPEAYETLSQIRVPGHYIEPGVHVRAERPVFSFAASGCIQQVTFNNYDRAPMRLSQNDEERFYTAYRLFHTYVNNQKHWVKIPLRPGMTLIFDNWRVLHGRMGYVGKRVFYGCYHSRATFESRLRFLQSQSKKEPNLCVS